MHSDRKRAAVATNSMRSAVTAAAFVAYLLFFYLAPIPEFKSPEHPAGVSRGALLANELLLVDDLALGRRQPDGQRAGDGWFGNPPEFALLDRVRVLVPALALLAICGATGWLLLSLARADRRLDRLEVMFFSVAVGMSAVSLYTFAIGVLGLLQFRWLFLVPAAAVLAQGTFRLWRVKTGQPVPNRRGASAREEAGGKQQSSTAAAVQLADGASSIGWLWWLVPFSVVIVLAGTLTPFEFDVLEYHLQVPKEFYQQGRIDFLPHNVYGNMPLASEMLSLAAMAAVGDWWFGALVGKTVIAMAAPVTALGLFTAGRRLVGTATGVVAALVFISIPWIARISSLGLVEGVSALFLWGTAYAVLLWWRDDAEGRLSRALLAGFLAGTAAACKYPNVFFVLLPSAAVVAIRSWRTASWYLPDDQNAKTPSTLWRLRLLPAACFLLAAGVACGPWYAKNWLLTGNPVYPLAYGLFDGRARTTELDAQWRRAHRSPGFGVREVGDSVANVAWRSPWLSPLVLPLAVLGVVGTWFRRIAWGLAGYVVFYFGFWWLFTHRIDRFWVPIDPVLAFLAGLSVSPGARVTWRLPVKALLGCALAVNLFFLVAGGGGDTSYFVSLPRLREAPARVQYWHRYLNEHVGEDQVVLAVGDATVFDLKMPVLYSTVFDGNQFEELMNGRTPVERREELARLGVAYVTVYWADIARYRSPGNYGFTDYVTPELFAELVREGVLDPPLVCPDPAEKSVGYEVYPVPGAGGRAAN